MLDRGFSRNLYAAALQASGGDREWAAGIVASWAWSEEDLDDVAALVRETLELYQAAHMMRPDLLLGIAVLTHAGGYIATMTSLRQRAAEARQIAVQAARETPPRPNGEAPKSS
jgi:translation elongation factor EF-Ts